MKRNIKIWLWFGLLAIILINISISTGIYSKETLKFTNDVRKDHNNLLSATNFNFDQKSELAYNKVPSNFKNMQSEPINQLDPHYIWKNLTKEDVNILKNDFGVYDPHQNYSVQYRGHGTGALPMSEGEWAELIGKPTVTDINPKFNNTEFPHQIDYSQTPYFPPTGNQGSQPSCCTWALVYYAYGFAEAKDQEWDASSGNPNYQMSPAWVYNKVKGANEGTSVGVNIKILTNLGCATMAICPYNEADDQNWGNEASFREAPLHRAKTSRTGFYRPDDDVVPIIKNLLNQSILPVFYMDPAIYPENCWGTEFIVAKNDLESGGGSHCQTIVGYDDSVEKDGEIGAFKIINSWGAEFGNNGYYWITYDAINDMTVSLHWLEDIPHYQPKLLATWDFSQPPDKSTGLAIGIGTPENTIKSLNFQRADYESVPLPSFMAMDITDLYSYYQRESADFYIKLSTINDVTGILSSFFIELYENTYSFDNPDQISPPSSSVPLNIEEFSKVYATTYLPGKPSPPLYVMYKNSSEEMLQISWNYPLSASYSAISEYRIYDIDISPEKFSSEEFDPDSIPEESIQLVKSVIPADPYKPQFIMIPNTLDLINHTQVMTSLNEYGESIFSDPAVLFNPEKPDPPEDISINFKKTSVVLTWEIPKDLGGGINISYHIYRGNNSKTLSEIAHIWNMETYQDNTGKSAKSDFLYYAIATENEAGVGISSDPIEVDYKSGARSIGFSFYPVFILAIGSYLFIFSRTKKKNKNL